VYSTSKYCDLQDFLRLVKFHGNYYGRFTPISANQHESYELDSRPWGDVVETDNFMR
jgi:hypothetical protein